jgi:hypothetical protein
MRECRTYGSERGRPATAVPTATPATLCRQWKGSRKPIIDPSLSNSTHRRTANDLRSSKWEPVELIVNLTTAKAIGIPATVQ